MPKQKKHPILQKNKLSPGQRASDSLSEFMGSWTFLWVFLVVLIVWMAVNVAVVKFRWDPYPFILLNLALSCVSALQAPIILMSENRQAERDRTAAKYDHAVNKKAEKEIRDMQKDLDEIKDLIRSLKK